MAVPAFGRQTCDLEPTWIARSDGPPIGSLSSQDDITDMVVRGGFVHVTGNVFIGAHSDAGDSNDITVVRYSPTNVETFCVTSPNSVGAGAQIGLAGTARIASNDLLLGVSGVAPNTFGLFFTGQGPSKPHSATASFASTSHS